jgi:hypothetical protein
MSMTEQEYEPTASDGDLVDPASEGFALILIPEDVLNKLHTDFSIMVGTHLADQIFYQIGFRCGEVSSSQYEAFLDGKDEWIDFLLEAVNQSGLGEAELESRDGYDLDIKLMDHSPDSIAIQLPGFIFAAGFIAGFATNLSDARFRCLWDVPDRTKVGVNPILHLKGVPTHKAILGDKFKDLMKGGDK